MTQHKVGACLFIVLNCSNIFQDLFRSTMKPVQKVMEDADMKKTDIDEIVLVGGSTRIPKVQQLVKEYFSGKVRCNAFLITRMHVYVHI